MTIKGSLKDYSLLEIMTILSNKRESGRLHIDFTCGQASFDFSNGELTAACVGNLTGFSAVNVALQMEGTHFRFLSTTDIDATHFSDKNERLMLNLVLSNLRATCGVESSPEDSKQAQPKPPAASQPKPQPDQWTKKADLQFESVPTFDTPALRYTEKRSRVSWALSILLIGLLAAAAIAAFRIRPKQQAAALPSPPAKVTSEKSEPSSGSTDKLTQLADHAIASARFGSEAAAHKTSPAPPDSPFIPSNSTAPKTNKAEAGVPVESTAESKVTPPRSFREIPVVIRVEDGHVAEAFVRNHEPGMEAFESTAIRLARQRRYPKDQLGTQTVVFRVASEQQGVAKK